MDEIIVFFCTKAKWLFRRVTWWELWIFMRCESKSSEPLQNWHIFIRRSFNLQQKQIFLKDRCTLFPYRLWGLSEFIFCRLSWLYEWLLSWFWSTRLMESCLPSCHIPEGTHSIRFLMSFWLQPWINKGSTMTSSSGSGKSFS
jgi:hypothetical protein